MAQTGSYAITSAATCSLVIAVEPVLDLTIEHGDVLSPSSRSSSVSPMQTIGVSLALSAATTLRFTISIGLAEQPPSLRVPDDHVLRPRLASMPALTSPVNAPSRSSYRVWPATPTFVIARRLRHRMQSRERRRHDDLDVVDVLHDAAELLDEHDRLVDGLVHLPVRCDEWRAHDSATSYQLLSSASTPGNVRPARNSSEAPPPVEMCVILPVTPAFATAAIESPPPITVVPLTDATARRHFDGSGRELVDLEDAHRTVPDDGLAPGDDVPVTLHRSRADVETHAIADRRIRDR